MLHSLPAFGYIDRAAGSLGLTGLVGFIDRGQNSSRLGSVEPVNKFVNQLL